MSDHIARHEAEDDFLTKNTKGAAGDGEQEDQFTGARNHSIRTIDEGDINLVSGCQDVAAVRETEELIVVENPGVMQDEPIYTLADLNLVNGCQDVGATVFQFNG